METAIEAIPGVKRAKFLSQFVPVCYGLGLAHENTSLRNKFDLTKI